MAQPMTPTRMAEEGCIAAEEVANHGFVDAMRLVASLGDSGIAKQICEECRHFDDGLCPGFVQLTEGHTAR